MKAISICQGAVESAVYETNDALSKVVFSRDARRKFKSKYSPLSPIRQGLDLIRKFSWMAIHTQHRSIDPEHTRFVSKLWKGEPMTVRDLMQYKTLCPNDLAGDRDWLEAPFLVSTNQERLTMLHIRAVAFAKAHATCVLRWRLDSTKWRGCPRDPECRRNAQDDPSFFDYFVSGAPGFITANFCPK